jgi:hypothetical protein
MTKNEANAEECLKLAAKLVLVPDFPRQPGSVETTSDILLEMCESVEEAERLVSDAMKWEKWRGIAGLVELAEYNRRPHVLPPERQIFHAGPPPPAAKCKICDGWGHYWNGTATALCSCSEGSHPNVVKLVEAMNRKHVRGSIMRALQASTPRRPITSEDVEFARRQNRTQKEISEARAVLAREDATAEQKEIARKTLDAYGATEQAS